MPVLEGATDDRILMDEGEMAAIAAANVLPPQALSDDQIADLIAFLKALEDPAERLGVPQTVPSGLPVDQ